MGINMMIKKVFITGINGQDGAYLAQYLHELGHEIHGSIRDYLSELSNLTYLNVIDNVKLHAVDLENYSDVKKILDKLQPDLIFNLAAQSSVGASFSEPFNTLKPNFLILLNLLEYLRFNKHIRLYQSSSSEMYGNPNVLPIKENDELNPISPYGLSKSIGFQILNIYRNTYGLYAVNGIMFNHESYLRRENFFIKKIIKQAINIKFGFQKFIEVGNLDVKRDFGYSKDYVKFMYKSLLIDIPDDYIFCSGQSTSLKEIIYYVFHKLGLSTTLIHSSVDYFRPNEIFEIYGDNSKARRILDWDYNKTIWELLDILIYEEYNNFIK